MKVNGKAPVFVRYGTPILRPYHGFKQPRKKSPFRSSGRFFRLEHARHLLAQFDAGLGCSKELMFQIAPCVKTLCS